MKLLDKLTKISVHIIDEFLINVPSTLLLLSSMIILYGSTENASPIRFIAAFFFIFLAICRIKDKD